MNLYITVFTLFFMIVILIVISKYIKTYCPKKQCENIDKFYDISFSITSDTFDNNIPLTTSEKHSIDIFLSHSTIDYKQVRKLRNALEEEDFRPLMFHLKCLEESDDNEIFDLLKREIDAREWFILCKSPHAESSKWVQKEMEYVQKHKVPIVIDINSNTWNIKEIMDMLRENNDINLIYPKNLFSALQNVKKHLQINYNISEIVYQENPLELSSIYKTINNLLIVISEDSHHFLLELSERSDFNTCIFVITDKQKSLKPLLLDVIPIFLLPPDTDEWLMEFNFALQCLTLRKRIEFSKSKKDNYIELCYTYRKLGDLYHINGYTAQAAQSYSTARRIAQENENWELANFYFSNFEEDLHFELRGSTIIYSLSDYLNNTKI